jgi:hypothetical protein
MKAFRITLLIAGIFVAWIAFNTATQAQTNDRTNDRLKKSFTKNSGVKDKRPKHQHKSETKTTKLKLKQEAHDKAQKSKVKEKRDSKESLKRGVKYPAKITVIKRKRQRTQYDALIPNS